MASIITINSIKLSFVGTQVGWMINTSLPRTFSWISTEISPSLNTPTAAFPSGMSRCRAMVRAISGFAFPVKTIKSFVPTLPTMGFSRCAKILGRESDGTFCTISTAHHLYGWAGWIRTNACQDQNLVPYRLATAQ